MRQDAGLVLSMMPMRGDVCCVTARRWPVSARQWAVARTVALAAVCVRDDLWGCARGDGLSARGDGDAQRHCMVARRGAAVGVASLHSW